MENYVIEKLLDRKEIEGRIVQVAAQIDQDYRGENPIIAVVLKGGFVFAADLVRDIHTPFNVDFVGASSYKGTKSSGDIKITKDLDNPIGGRHVILVEDIVDTGLTLFNLKKLLEQRNPLSVKIATLLLKDIDRPFDLPVDYYAFKIPDKFVVGFGLDYNEMHRGLPYVGYLKAI
jgi:hypoxanthine phosphoribosyltransferase